MYKNTRVERKSVEKVKISVITVSFNAEKTIEQTIKSVLSQNYDNLEYIIVDGASTDSTLDIVRKYENKIAYWISEPDNGVYDAMNKGLSCCSGDVIAFLNSDDIYVEGAIKYVADFYENHKETEVLCCEVLINKDGNKASHYNAWEKYQEKLREGVMMYCHQGIFATKSCFERYGSFDSQYKIAADYAWLLNLYNHNVQICYSPEIVAEFRCGGLCTTEHFVTADEVEHIAIKAADDLRKHKEVSDKEYESLRGKIKKMADKRYLNGYANLGETKIIQIKNDISEKCHLLENSYSIFGIGENGCNCLNVLRKLGMQVVGLFDNDSSKWGKEVEGVTVKNPQEIAESDTIVLVASQYYEEEIFEQLAGMGLVEGIDYMSCTEVCDWIEIIEQ